MQTDFQSANDNGTMPTEVVAVEPTRQQSTIKMYTVPISTLIRVCFQADVEVYATTPAEAVAKVQGQIDHEALDGDLQMEDGYSGYMMSCRDVAEYFGYDFDIDEECLEVNDEYEVDPADVLKAEVEELRTSISW